VDAESGDTCCDSTVAGQCQVQAQRGVLTRYVDATNQRMRVDDAISGKNLVYDAKGQQELTVNVSASGEVTCVSICPAEVGNLTHTFLPSDATDKGSTTYEGEAVEVFAWVDRLKVIKMADVQLWVKLGSTSVPALRFETLTPLGGPPIGQQNVSYATFTPGAPGASKFDVKGIDTCPQLSSMECSSGPGLQAHRLLSRQYLTWAMYEPFSPSLSPK